MDPAAPESDRASLYRHPRSVPEQYLDIDGSKTFQRSKSLQGILRARRKRNVICMGLLVLTVLVVAAGIIGGIIVKIKMRATSSNAAEKVCSTDSLTSVTDFKQLPAPNTPQARALQADPQTPGNILDLYLTAGDTANITANITSAFLQQMQLQIKTHLKKDLDLSPFIDAANVVVDLLRVTRCTALLTLLRQYSQEGVFRMTTVDMEQLKGEVVRVMQVAVLEHYYRLTSVRDERQGEEGSRAWPTSVIPGETSGGTLGRRHLVAAVSPVVTAASATGSTWLMGSSSGPYGSRSSGSSSSSSSSSSRVLHASGSGSGDLPEKLQDMLCATARWAGRQEGNCTTPNFVVQEGSGFKPVKVPVVFHCMRYKDESGYLHPLYANPEKDAEHLIDATNKLYTGTGIQFTLEEVRHDPAEYPYLVIEGGLCGWQACALRPGGSSACVDEVVSKFGAGDYQVNVVLVGARWSSAYCSQQPSDVCTQLYLGYCSSVGPWMPNPQHWTESDRRGNWITMLYDYISPDEKNSAEKWDGGAATLGHELGHYLGLRHTHEGECGGNEGDAVSDTPPNRDIESFARDEGLLPELAGWCVNYRNGKRPDPTELMKYDSCPDNGGIHNVDNVFNIESYLPDECVMMFSEEQVARMQWVIAEHRPRMMAKYAV